MLIKPILLLSLLLSSSAALAATAPPALSKPAPAVPASPKPTVSPSESTSQAAQSITDLNEQTAVLSARLVQIELQFKIAQKQADLNKLSGHSGDLLAPNSAGNEVAPLVKSITGMNGRLDAVLVFPEGATMLVVRGSKLPSGWVVENISPGSVTLSRHGSRKILMSGVSPPASSSPSGVMPALPGVPAGVVPSQPQ